MVDGFLMQSLNYLAVIAVPVRHGERSWWNRDEWETPLDHGLGSYFDPICD